MSDPPITSKATTAGEVAVPIVAASASHPAPSELPAAMMQYSRTSLMPMETASPMYRSVYGAVHRDPPNPRNRYPEHREHDRPDGRRQSPGALLAGRRGLHHDRHDPPRLL